MTEFVDLLPELRALAHKRQDLSPHEQARRFVIAEGQAREGVESIVVTDSQGKFIGAGTQNLPAGVNFPPVLQERLQDPKANLVLHHNHPPSEEAFLSDTDIRSLTDHRGIGWLLMHNKASYTAVRASDKIFMPNASGMTLANHLTAAYKTSRLMAQFTLFNHDIGADPDVMEAVAPALALQAMQQVGVIKHFTSLTTGMGYEREQEIIRQIRVDAATSPEPSSGVAIWGGTQGTVIPATPGGHTRTHRGTAVPYPSTLNFEFERFMGFLSRPHPAALDPGATGRPKSAQLPEAGGNDSGLESQRPAGRSLLESGQVNKRQP